MREELEKITQTSKYDYCQVAELVAGIAKAMEALAKQDKPFVLAPNLTNGLYDYLVLTKQLESKYNYQPKKKGDITSEDVEYAKAVLKLRKEQVIKWLGGNLDKSEEDLREELAMIELQNLKDLVGDHYHRWGDRENGQEIYRTVISAIDARTINEVVHQNTMLVRQKQRRNRKINFYKSK